MALKIEMETAIRLYPESSEWFKEVLIKAFGKECFEKPDFRDIKTFSDACKAIGTTEKEFNSKFEKLGLDVDTIFYEKTKIVVKAINQGWVPNWENNNEKKWYPYFNLSSGFGFSGTVYTYDSTRTGVGSRLCFESKEKADYVGRQFLKLYEKFLK